MKNFFKNVLRVLLWVLILLVLAGILYVLKIIFEFSMATLVMIVGACCALILGTVLFKRFITRRKRLTQINAIVNLELSKEAVEEESLIANRWTRAISIMRSSYLGRFGNPLYALPWYMVMGKTGAGKSSSIEYAGLCSMQTDLGPESHITNTRNCNWYFFNEAVVMDTAGRYALFDEASADSAEWAVFLQKLAMYRRKEPLNGLVVMVAADTLHGDGRHLQSEAKALRRRIDEVMRILGSNFPVYLMVSKIDLLPGMGQLLETLSPEACLQSLGTLVQESTKQNIVPIEVQIKNAMHALNEKIRSFCLYGGVSADASVYTHGSEAEPEYPPYRLLAFEEFCALMPALHTYAQEIFTPNPYQESPILRGIFFSSALRADTQKECFIPFLSAITAAVLKVKERTGGVFLHNFYKKILPSDRTLHYPIAEYLRWNSSMRVLAYATFLCVTFGFGVLLSFSYSFNQQLIKSIPNSVPFDASASNEKLLIDFEKRFRVETALEQSIRSPQAFLANKLGLTQGTDFYEAYAVKLDKQFTDQVLKKITGNHDVLWQEVDAQGLEKQELFNYVSSLIWYYDLLHAVQQGKSFEDLLHIPAMTEGMLNVLGLQNSPHLKPSLAYSVARSIYFLRDEEELDRQLRRIQVSLEGLPQVQDVSLRWVVHRAGTLSSLPKITGSTFWAGAQDHIMDFVVLDPVYTAEGFKVVMQYLDNVNQILGDKTLQITPQFMQWYSGKFRDAWQEFALKFVTEAQKMALLPVSKSVSSAMSLEDNPYFSLLTRMNTELATIRPYLDKVPQWMEHVDIMAKAIHIITDTERKEKKLGLLESLHVKTQSLINAAVVNLDIENHENDLRAQEIVASLQEYLTSLKALVNVTANKGLAFTAVKDAMPHEHNEKALQAPLNIATVAAHTLNAKIDSRFELDSLPYELTTGPLNFFTTLLMNMASCQIQAMWEGDILSKAGKLVPTQLQQSLFNETDGLVRNFADTTLNYYLDRSMRGYDPSKFEGYAIPFTPDFLTFLSVGMAEYTPTRSEYSVAIDALPISVNEGASEMPFAVDLSLQCTREQQTLTNYNSPASQTFIWQNGTCGDTALNIHFKTFSLSIVYVGENGFINFLDDFKYGSKTFYAHEFSKEEKILQGLGVDEITVGYKIRGADEIISGHSFAPGQLPFVITQCKK